MFFTSFVHEALAVRVLFGPGQGYFLKDEVRSLECDRAFIVCSETMARRIGNIIAGLEDFHAGTYDNAKPHCPENIVAQALDKFTGHDADSVVAIGGGSTIGLGKNIAAETRKPLICLPTTYSGSEMTAIVGMLTGNEKRTRIDPYCRAATVIYDPELTLSLPKSVTATSGMNSLAHCVEALYAENRNPLAFVLAKEGIRSLARGLRRATGCPHDLSARSETLYGAMLGGMVVTFAGIALHHKICHVLGGRHQIAHGASNAVILPHVIAYNADYIPEAMTAIGQCLGTEADEAAEGIFKLAGMLDCFRSLRELGMPEESIADAAEACVMATTYNPRPVDRLSLEKLLRRAWKGDPPAKI